MLPISLVVIAHNEGKNLERCLRSVFGWVKEIVVVINDCTDDTQQIALSFHAHVIEHPWSNYAEQRNFATRCAHEDWILRLDADEVLTEDLKLAIENFLKRSDKDLYSVCFCKRQNAYFGKFLRYGFSQDSIPVLMKKDSVHWEGIVHEKLLYSKKAFRLQGVVQHYTESSVKETLQKQIKYAQLMAVSASSKSYWNIMRKILFNPGAEFIRHYILGMGFLDGFAGFYYAVLRSYYTFMKYVLALEQKNGCLKKHPS